MLKVEIDGIEFTVKDVRKGDTLAFYNDEDNLSNYFVAICTSVLQKNARVHLVLLEPNGFTVRKRVDIADNDRVKFRFLPIAIAHSLEDEVA